MKGIGIIQPSKVCCLPFLLFVDIPFLLLASLATACLKLVGNDEERSIEDSFVDPQRRVRISLMVPTRKSSSSWTYEVDHFDRVLLFGYDER